VFDAITENTAVLPESLTDRGWPAITDDGLRECAVRTAFEPPPPTPSLGSVLDSLEAGPDLLRILSALDIDSLPEHDRVPVLRAWNRSASHAQAGVFRAMASISDAYEDLLDDRTATAPAAAAEIRAALRLTRRTAESELSQALDLRSRLPRVFQAMSDGRIDRRRASVLLRHTDHLPTFLARDVTDPLVDRAHMSTTGQLAEALRRRCLEVDPDDARHRYRERVTERRVVTHSEPDGTITMMAIDLPAVRVSEAMDRVNRLARKARTSSESRSMDQLRADILLDLLCGTPDTHHGSVHVTVDLATLTELSDRPGDVAGYGPVVADIARQTARALRDATWSVTVTDSDTGSNVHHGTTRRRPSSEQRRRIQQRQPVCRFPGCRMPAVGSDIDHRTPWADGGDTTPGNLAPLCRHDHCVRHQSGWSYEPLPDGDHMWTSPLGHRYTTSGRDP